MEEVFLHDERKYIYDKHRDKTFYSEVITLLAKLLRDQILTLQRYHPEIKSMVGTWEAQLTATLYERSEKNIAELKTQFQNLQKKIHQHDHLAPLFYAGVGLCLGVLSLGLLMATMTTTVMMVCGWVIAALSLGAAVVLGIFTPVSHARFRQRFFSQGNGLVTVLTDEREACAGLVHNNQ